MFIVQGKMQEYTAIPSLVSIYYIACHCIISCVIVFISRVIVLYRVSLYYIACHCIMSRVIVLYRVSLYYVA